IQLCNTGVCDLLVSGVIVTGTGFSLVSPNPAPTPGSPLHISHDFCFPFRFRFTPVPGATGSGSVTFLTNDPAHPILIIGLTATIGAPKLDVNSTSHTFGTLCAGQTATWPLEVFNTGDCDLTITSIAPPPGVINDTEFALLPNPAIPTRISPDAHVDYSI